MASKMKCAELTGPDGRLRIVTRAAPTCPTQGVLVRTLYGGICYTDMHFNQDYLDLGNGVVERLSSVIGENFKGAVMGHEIAGVVHGIGCKVSKDCNLNIGDKVVVYPFLGCCKPACMECQAGEYQLCRDNRSGTTCIGHGMMPGGFGNYVAVHDWRVVIKVPPSIPLPVSAMLACSGLTTYSALLEIAPKLEMVLRLRGKANILIIGFGGLGMWLMYTAKLLFEEKNITFTCADINQEKLDLATEMGADDTVEWPTQSRVEDIVKATTKNGTRLFDFTFDLVGMPRTVDAAVQCLMPGGEASLIGLRGGQYNLSIPLTIFNKTTIRGIKTGSLKSFNEFLGLIGDTASRESFPSYHMVKLEDVNDVFDKLKRNELVGRAIIKHEEEIDLTPA